MKKKKKRIDYDRIARLLGGEIRGTVHAGGGWFGALQLLGEVRARFQVPPRGGRATNPEWTERRLIPLAPETLRLLEKLAAQVGVDPMQVAAVLLEKATADAEKRIK